MNRVDRLSPDNNIVELKLPFVEYIYRHTSLMLLGLTFRTTHIHIKELLSFLCYKRYYRENSITVSQYLNINWENGKVKGVELIGE